MQSAEEFELLITTNSQKELKSLFTEIMEIGLDTCFTGVTKEIPVLKTIIGASTAIRSAFFLKKLLAFTKEISETSLEDRQKTINDINSSKKYRSSVGETLLEYLDRVESDDKPQIIGKMFVAVINEDITYKEFLKATHILSKMFYWDLLELKENTNSRNEVIYDIPDEVNTSGLTKTTMIVDFVQNIENAWKGREANNSEKSTITSLTRIGEIIINIGFAD